MSSPDLAVAIARAVASLDRVCSACMAANSRASWVLLHRDRRCNTIDARIPSWWAWTAYLAAAIDTGR